MSFIEPDLERDQITVTFDPMRVTTARLLEIVGEQGFEGTIRAAGPMASPPAP